jgi:putative redox protein
MITTQSKDLRYQVQYSNGLHTAISDAPVAKGGGAVGIGPHELLEASLAACINMWIRMQADKLGIQAGNIEVSVLLKRDNPEEAIFEYGLKLDSILRPEDRAKLLEIADDCPVRRTLSKRLVFRARETLL